METDRIVGFCILLRRSVIDDIGLFDERFRVGGFEDDDLCRRAIDAVYKVSIASHVFVHHFRSVTFKANGIDLVAIMDQNRRRFKEKWSNESKTND